MNSGCRPLSERAPLAVLAAARFCAATIRLKQLRSKPVVRSRATRRGLAERDGGRARSGMRGRPVQPRIWASGRCAAAQSLTPERGQMMPAVYWNSKLVWLCFAGLMSPNRVGLADAIETDLVDSGIATGRTGRAGLADCADVARCGGARHHRVCPFRMGLALVARRGTARKVGVRTGRIRYCFGSRSRSPQAWSARWFTCRRQEFHRMLPPALPTKPLATSSSS
jgi:hypothetical protein